MARDFLAQHGIDIDAELQRIQSGTDQSIDVDPHQSPISLIARARLAGKDSNTCWDVTLKDGRIQSVDETSLSSRPSEAAVATQTIDAAGRLLAPSLCHPHIHVDKAFLLAHPRYRHLQIQRGDFQEAMDLTGEAKSQFTEDDLLERGRRVVDESVRAGVTHMRAFFEVDAGVHSTCIDAGLRLRREVAPRCVLQVCAFAQLPLFTATSADPDGSTIRTLIEQAATTPDVDVLGSTPYVESDRGKMESNVDWIIDLAIAHNKHIDFHLDYHLDQATEPLIWYVLKRLHDKGFANKTQHRTVVLGHCTRLTLFDADSWSRVRQEIKNHGLPVSFVGLPTSDLFMMRSEQDTRGTLNVPKLIREVGVDACLGINNIGNAFTPHGSCDPLTLALHGVGVYQASTNADAEVLYEAVSTRARRAIGLDERRDQRLDADIRASDPADLILYAGESEDWRTRKDLTELVHLYDHAAGRTVLREGVMVSDGHAFR